MGLELLFVSKLIQACLFLQVRSLFDRLDLKKAGLLRHADFESFFEDNPDFLLIFLIGKPGLL